MFCLDFDYDSKSYRPLTVFRCDRTFSTLAKAGHQKWEYVNASYIRNVGTGKCVASGKQIYPGKAVEQFDCAKSNDQKWIWVPFKWYKELHVPR
jgi:hypothetical protein